MMTDLFDAGPAKRPNNLAADGPLRGPPLNRSVIPTGAVLHLGVE